MTQVSASNPLPPGLTPASPCQPTLDITPGGVDVTPGGGVGPASPSTDPSQCQLEYLKARVKTYSAHKGFGFLHSSELEELCGDVFVFNTHLVGRLGLIAGEKVEFVLIWGNWSFANFICQHF